MTSVAEDHRRKEEWVGGCLRRPRERWIRGINRAGNGGTENRIRGKELLKACITIASLADTGVKLPQWLCLPWVL